MDLSQIYLAVSIFKILLVALVLILNHQKRKFINKLTLDSSLAVSKVRQETKLRKTRWLILPNIHVVTFINFFEKILPLGPFWTHKGQRLQPQLWLPHLCQNCHLCTKNEIFYTIFHTTVTSRLDFVRFWEELKTPKSIRN